MNEARFKCLLKNRCLHNSEKNTPELIKLKKEFLEAIRDGDAKLFGEYYIGFIGSLIRFIAKIIGNEQEAEEIAQEVFAYTWEHRERVIQPDKELDSFIFTVAKNMAYKSIRKRLVHSKYNAQQRSSYDDLDLSADEIYMSEETSLLLRQALNTMTPQQRKAFELSRYENLSYDEIAVELNISHNTVKTHIRLALKRIREFVY